MARFIAKLNDDSYINIPADAIKIANDAVIAWKADTMVAYISKDFCLCAHLSDNDKSKEERH